MPQGSNPATKQQWRCCPSRSACLPGTHRPARRPSGGQWGWRELRGWGRGDTDHVPVWQSPRLAKPWMSHHCTWCYTVTLPQSYNCYSYLHSVQETNVLCLFLSWCNIWYSHHPPTIQFPENPFPHSLVAIVNVLVSPPPTSRLMYPQLNFKQLSFSSCDLSTLTYHWL